MDTITNKMTKLNFNIDYQYTDRESKLKWVAEKYKDILKGKILDVGADQMYLKNYLSEGTEYVGVGLGDHPEQVVVNLEENNLPFENNTFDCVMCLDVLEHLENIYSTFNELCRVSKDWVIISLPNPYSSFMNYLINGKYSADKNIKHYGLPKEKEADRHRWFFSAIEAREFVRHNAEKNGYEIYDLFVREENNEGLPVGNSDEVEKIKEARKLIFRNDLNFPELYEGTLFWVLKKTK